MKKYLEFCITYASAIGSILFYFLTVANILFFDGTDKYPLFITALLFHILHYVEHREG